MTRQAEKKSSDKPLKRAQDEGNAMVYVLIVVALFAALSFVMSRQNDGGESEALSEERIQIAASSLQQTSARVQQSIEQMVWSGTKIDDLLFMPSTDPTFEDRPFFECGVSAWHE